MHVLDSDVTELQARFLVTSQPPLSCVLCVYVSECACMRVYVIPPYCEQT